MATKNFLLKGPELYHAEFIHLTDVWEVQHVNKHLQMITICLSIFFSVIIYGKMLKSTKKLHYENSHIEKKNEKLAHIWRPLKNLIYLSKYFTSLKAWQRGSVNMVINLGPLYCTFSVIPPVSHLCPIWRLMCERDLLFYQ